jgi:hypothetical protein
MGFRTEPPSKPDGESAARSLGEWINEAPLTHKRGRGPGRKPWQGLKRNERPAKPHRLVVELNPYLHTLLRVAAQKSGMSMHRQAQRGLLTALERALNIKRDGLHIDDDDEASE